MSTQGDNKQLMRRFTEEFWNRGNIAFADEIVAEDLIHDQLPADWPQGREGFKRLVQTWRVAFPDLHEHLEFVLAEGDRALGRFRLTGTHSGPFYGIEPTGRSVDIPGSMWHASSMVRSSNTSTTRTRLGYSASSAAFRPTTATSPGPFKTRR